MIISEIVDNEVILYDLKLNKNRLKSIRKKLVAKYGYRIKYGEKIIKKEEIEEYENKNNFLKPIPMISYKKIQKENNETIYIPINHPHLATHVSECLHNPMEFQYMFYLNESSEKFVGKEYMPEILENIKLTEIYRSQFINGGELLEKMLDNVSKNSDLYFKLLEMKQYILCSEFSKLKESKKLIKKKIQTKDIK